MSWFNPADHDPSFGGRGAPVGKFPIVFTASKPEASSNNAQSGKLVFTAQIIDGPFKGQTFNWSFNIWNVDETSKKIAAQHISAICHVTRTGPLEAKPEGVELWNKPFMVEFQKQIKDERYTECVNVWDMQGNSADRGMLAGVQTGGQQQPIFNQPAASAQPGFVPNGGAAPGPSWAGGSPNPQGQPGQQGQPQGQSSPSWQQQPQGGAAPGPSWAR